MATVTPKMGWGQTSRTVSQRLVLNGMISGRPGKSSSAHNLSSDQLIAQPILFCEFHWSISDPSCFLKLLWNPPRLLPFTWCLNAAWRWAAAMFLRTNCAKETVQVMMDQYHVLGPAWTLSADLKKWSDLWLKIRDEIQTVSFVTRGTSWWWMFLSSLIQTNQTKQVSWFKGAGI